MIIGMNPGRVELEQGRPFVGPAGKMLDSMLEEADLDRGELYVTNVVKVGTPGNREPTNEEVQADRGDLVDEIREVSPRVILALGGFAMGVLTGRTGVTGMRGRVARLLGIYGSSAPVLVTFHPAGVLRNPEFKGPALKDIKLFGQMITKEVGGVAEAPKKESIVARIKKNMEAARAGMRFENLPYFKEGDKKRYRFLSDMEPHDEFKGPIEMDGHTKWGDDGLWWTPCEKYEGKECQYCLIVEREGTGRDKIKTFPYYAFTIRDLDEKKNFIFAFQAGGASPIPAMIEMYEQYGTLLDRAYTVKLAKVGNRRLWTLIPETPPDGGWKRPAGSEGMEPFKRSQVYEALKKAGGWKNPEGKSSSGAKGKGDDDD
jgi:DNA polymerase